MKKTHALVALVAAVGITLAGCTAGGESGEEPPADDALTFVKDDAATETFEFDFAVTGPEEENLAADTITVQGEDATLLEIMDWYFAEKDLNIEHDGQVVSVLLDLAGDGDQGWIVYVDDEMAEVGAADLVPAEGDEIEWRYVKYDELGF